MKRKKMPRMKFQNIFPISVLTPSPESLNDEEERSFLSSSIASRSPLFYLSFSSPYSSCGYSSDVSDVSCRTVKHSGRSAMQCTISDWRRYRAAVSEKHQKLVAAARRNASKFVSFLAYV